MPFYDQCHSEIRCEWGQRGVDVLAMNSDVRDHRGCLSFSTAVDLPCRAAPRFYHTAGKMNRLLNIPNRSTPTLSMSLATKEPMVFSPASLARFPRRQACPSLGKWCDTSLSTDAVPTLAGSFVMRKQSRSRRNSWAKSHCDYSGGVAMAGRKLRPAVEDWIAAGAIIHYLNGTRSPEAASATAAFSHSCSCR